MRNLSAAPCVGHAGNATTMLASSCCFTRRARPFSGRWSQRKLEMILDIERETNRRNRTFNRQEVLMPRSAIFGLICTAFLMLLGFPAVPQEPVRKVADPESGQLTFNNACRTCHTTKDGDNRLGPNLHNVIGRKAGSLPNYGYSSAMKGADFVWDKEKLDRFIAKPDEIVPGNNMKPYGGLTSAEDRAKVIAFLESPTGN